MNFEFSSKLQPELQKSEFCRSVETQTKSVYEKFEA
jgi:hypothetical protein